MSEHALWVKTRDLLHPHACLHRVENVVEPGMPDVWGHSRIQRLNSRWLELKEIAAWPARRTTNISFHRYSDQQREWLAKHEELAYLLMRVKATRHWLLFGGTAAGLVVGATPREEHERAAIWQHVGPAGEDVGRALSRKIFNLTS